MKLRFSPLNALVPARQTASVQPSPTPVPHTHVGTTYLAGIPSGSGTADGTGIAAHFNSPLCVAVDATENAYVTDQNNNTIRKITPAGVVTTFAGIAGVSGSHDDPVGTNATFNSPAGITIDPFGNLYVADSGNMTIRKITPAGSVSKLAGTTGAYGTSNGASPTFAVPQGVAADSSGNVYVVENSSKVRMIDSSGFVTVVAGGGAAGHDDTGTLAGFGGYMLAIGIDPISGDIYIGDASENLLRKMTPSGVVTTIAGGKGVWGHANGNGSAASFSYINQLTVDLSGNVYAADSANNMIRKIDSSANVTTFAGDIASGALNGTGTAARFNGVNGVALDGSGNLIVVDSYSNVIRKIDSGGVVTTLAGTLPSIGTQDGVGVAVSFNKPSAIVLDSAGNAYVGDMYSGTIRKIAPDHTVTTFAGNPATVQTDVDGTGTGASFYGIDNLAIDGSGNLYVAEAIGTIRKITPTGNVTTIAGAALYSGGTPVYGYANGPADSAKFGVAGGIAVDSHGNVFITDSGNCVIRKLDTSGTVSNFVGTVPNTCTHADGTGVTAGFYQPQGIVIDPMTDILYVTDSDSSIRKITPAGEVSTLAGIPGTTGSDDGPGASATFNYSGWPAPPAIDLSGNLYLADSNNYVIRKITPTGEVSTLIGKKGVPGYTDLTGTDAQFEMPDSVAVAPDGTIYVTDFGNSTVRFF